MVAYGAGGYVYRAATNGVSCVPSQFGGDPAFGNVKSCYVAPTGGPSGYTACAVEGGSCTLTGPRMVAYGANGAFTYRLLSATTDCSTAAFGGDPAFGVLKSCYLAPNGAPAGGFSQCAGEGGACAVAGAQTIFYGANGAFATATANGAIPCANSEFGGDPIAGVGKACYVRAGGPNGYGTRCAAENGACSFAGFQTVAYGADGRFVYKSSTSSAPCTTAAFGGDPIAGVAKNCYLTP
jgi:hypothetical protein